MTDKVTPIVEELGTVLRHSSALGLDHLVLVDDAGDFGHGDYPSLDELVQLVSSIRKGWSVRTRYDVIHISSPEVLDQVLGKTD